MQVPGVFPPSSRPVPPPQSRRSLFGCLNPFNWFWGVGWNSYRPWFNPWGVLNPFRPWGNTWGGNWCGARACAVSKHACRLLHACMHALMPSCMHACAACAACS